MIDTYLPRQLSVLEREFGSATNPVCVLVHDTQGVGPLIQHLCGRSAEPEAVTGDIAWFRLSNYLPTGERLVERVVDASKDANWIFIHTGCTVLPEAVRDLMIFVADQEAQEPRFVVLGESLDVQHGDDAMKALFFEFGSLVNLTRH